ncbi:MAG: hypothetical protein ACOY3I_01810 [Verrucomicrobiota bacterium]
MNHQELNSSLKKLTSQVSTLLEAGKEDQALSVMQKGLDAYRGASKWWMPDLFPLAEACSRYDHQGNVYDEHGKIVRGTERTKDGKIAAQGEEHGMFATNALIKKAVEVFGRDRAYEKLHRRGHSNPLVYYIQGEMWSGKYPQGVVSLRDRMGYDAKVRKIAEQIVEGHFSKVSHPDGRRVKKDGVTKHQLVGCVDSVLDELADRMASICKGNNKHVTDCGKIQKAEALMEKTFDAVGEKLKEYGSVIVEPNMEKLAAVCVDKKVDIKRLYDTGAVALGKKAFDGLRKYHSRYDSPLKQVTDYIHGDLAHSSRHNDVSTRIVAQGGRGGR